MVIWDAQWGIVTGNPEFLPRGRNIRFLVWCVQSNATYFRELRRAVAQPPRLLARHLAGEGACATPLAHVPRLSTRYTGVHR